jgi:hypothetical protein
MERKGTDSGGDLLSEALKARGLSSSFAAFFHFRRCALVLVRFQ